MATQAALFPASLPRPPPHKLAFCIWPPKSPKISLTNAMKSGQRTGSGRWSHDPKMPSLRAGTSSDPSPDRCREPEPELGSMTEKLGADVDSTRLAEELEQLEEEAITGGDEGRDPTDYSRRARIFDKSSQVFRAIKDRDAHTPELP